MKKTIILLNNRLGDEDITEDEVEELQQIIEMNDTEKENVNQEDDIFIQLNVPNCVDADFSLQYSFCTNVNLNNAFFVSQIRIYFFFYSKLSHEAIDFTRMSDQASGLAISR